MGLMVQEQVLREFMRIRKGSPAAPALSARFLISWPESTMGTRFYQAPTEGMPALRRSTSGLRKSWTVLLRSMKQARSLLGVDAIARGEGPLDQNITMALSATLDKAAISMMSRMLRASQPTMQPVLLLCSPSLSAARRAIIEEDDFRRAAQIALWHLSEARRFLGEFCMPEELTHAGAPGSWLIKWCREKGCTIISRRDIQQYGPYGNCAAKARLMPRLASFSELGRAREVKTGRTATFISTLQCLEVRHEPQGAHAKIQLRWFRYCYICYFCYRRDEQPLRNRSNCSNVAVAATGGREIRLSVMRLRKPSGVSLKTAFPVGARASASLLRTRQLASSCAGPRSPSWTA